MRVVTNQDRPQRRPPGGPPRRRRPPRRRAIAIAALVVLVFLVGPTLVRLAVDWLWFREIGFLRVLTTGLVAQAALAVGVSLVAFAFLWGNARAALGRGGRRPILVLGPDGKPRDVSAFVTRAALPVCLALALLIGFSARGAWLTVLQAMHATSFGVADPVFGRDVGHYVFVLPVIAGTLGLLFALGLLSLLLVLALVWLRREIQVAPGEPPVVTRGAGLHLAALAAFLLVITALRTWLVRLPELLYSTTGPLVGASYTDLHATRPGLHVAAVVALLAAAVLVAYALRGRPLRGAAIAVGGYLLVAIVARGLLPAAVQQLAVEPTELTRETPSLRRHIEMTRRAWGLDAVESRELSGAATITMADVEANATTIENVRLWDVDPLLQTFGQLQEIRTYYDFVSVDDDRYWIDGTYRQVLLSPRELNPASLPTRTFINEHLTFTHGMGLTLAPVNEATAEGLPVLFIRDLPPRSTVDLDVTRPQIYFGELTDSHVFVDTRQREFDYPAGDDNVFTAYEGAAGVPLGGPLRRALFAAYFGSGKVLLSGDLQATSRVLYHRSVAQRARKALPFLRFDDDPYLVIGEDGGLTWILDAYTSTTRYPYAARLSDRTSYLRNSVKVTIDAYDGTVTAYLADPDDPIARTLGRAFPGILTPFEAMPADLRAHVRYPGELYRTQMGLYTVYHMDDPAELYHREDQWQIPTMPQGGREVPFMRRIIMRLPRERGEEYIYMTPFTPRQKDNLTAWVVARSDGEHYGKLVEYRFPRQSLVFGPRQVVNRINQDTEISRQLSLWDQRGSEVIRGELMVIPIEEALVYVQPIFLRAQGGRIPEMKRVVVAYENQVVMEETLDEGLGRIFGAGAAATDRPAAAGEEPGAAEAEAGARADEAEAEAAADREPEADRPARPAGDLARRARDHYDRALAAQRAGDWARYGEEIRRLGEVIEEMAAEGGEPPPGG